MSLDGNLAAPWRLLKDLVYRRTVANMETIEGPSTLSQGLITSEIKKNEKMKRQSDFNAVNLFTSI